ncbi:BON domain-containing protein [Caballeronia glebae]|uniref:BON domain-containing protein n=1 Tax=Caballeronia glebae TaxID=1777143 RepID=UPI0038BA789C
MKTAITASQVLRACISKFKLTREKGMMKAIRIGSIFAGLLVATATLNVWAQDGSSASAGVAASSAQGKVADRALRKDVVRSLTRTKGLNTTRITVRVKDGLVMLQGSVPEQSEVDLATQAASRTNGVTAVKNTLTVIGPAGSQ